MDQPSYSTKAYLQWPFLGPPQQADEIGRLAQYRVLKQLGQGGMGIVFQAEDEQLRRPAALKVMLPDFAAQDDARERFLREARAAAKLKHDHVVTIYQVGEHNGVPFLAMEFLAGKSLEDWLRPDRRATVLEALNIGRQIAKGLAAAHSAGLVHRDIKPANLWLETPRGRIKILDFGLARITAGELTALTQNGAVLGTPAYMAPEQARGEVVDHRGDLFSFGCVLYRMVTGRLPFQGNTVYSVLSAIATVTPTPVRELNPDVPPRLGELIERLLAKSPDARPATAQAVFDELQEIDKEVRAHSGAAQTDSGGEGRSLPWKLWASVAAGVVLVAIMLIVSNPFGRRDAPSSAKVPPVGPVSAAPVNLLALVDIPKDCVTGSCKELKNGGLRVKHNSDGKGFGLRLPWEPPERYRLKLTVTRMNEAPDQLGVTLVAANGKASMCVDWYEVGTRTCYAGLADIKGRQLPARSDARKGPILVFKLPTTLTYTVEPGQVSLHVGGRRVYQWQGDLSSVFKEYKARWLHVYGVSTADFVFDEIVLEPLGPDAGQPYRRKE